MVRNLNALDAKFLGMTVIAIIREYDGSREPSERQAALLDVVALDREGGSAGQGSSRRTSPRYVRHKDAIATGVAVVDTLAGKAGVVSGFLIR